VARPAGRPNSRGASRGHPSGAVTTSWWAPAPASCSRCCSTRTCALGVNHHTPDDQAGSTSATAGWQRSSRLTLRSSSTPVAPPASHQRPPRPAAPGAAVVPAGQTARSDSQVASGRSAPGTAAAQRTLDAAPGSRRARQCSRPGNRGGGTPAATGRAHGAGRRTASFRTWLGRAQGSRASRSSSRSCCPFAARGRIRGADLAGGEAFALVTLTRPQVIRGFALCLPLPNRSSVHLL
jgi:hypothetical protein